MTTFDYARARATAQRLIARFGQNGHLVRSTPGSGTHNPGAPTEDRAAVKFVITDFERRDVDGERVLATDKRVYMSAVGLERDPTTKDVLEDAARLSYPIVAVRPLSPGGIVVLYELQVRR